MIGCEVNWDPDRDEVVVSVLIPDGEGEKSLELARIPGTMDSEDKSNYLELLRSWRGATS